MKILSSRYSFIAIGFLAANAAARQTLKMRRRLLVPSTPTKSDPEGAQQQLDTPTTFTNASIEWGHPGAWKAWASSLRDSEGNQLISNNGNNFLQSAHIIGSNSIPSSSEDDREIHTENFHDAQIQLDSSSSEETNASPPVKSSDDDQFWFASPPSVNGDQVGIKVNVDVDVDVDVDVTRDDVYPFNRRLHHIESTTSAGTGSIRGGGLTIAQDLQLIDSNSSIDEANTNKACVFVQQAIGIGSEFGAAANCGCHGDFDTGLVIQCLFRECAAASDTSEELCGSVGLSFDFGLNQSGLIHTERCIEYSGKLDNNCLSYRIDVRADIPQTSTECEASQDCTCSAVMNKYSRTCLEVQCGSIVGCQSLSMTDSFDTNHWFSDVMLDVGEFSSSSLDTEVNSSSSSSKVSKATAVLLFGLVLLVALVAIVLPTFVLPQ